MSELITQAALVTLAIALLMAVSIGLPETAAIVW